MEPPRFAAQAEPLVVALHCGRMTIGIIGLGYVGLPLAVAFAEAGHCVVAVDTDMRKVEALRSGRSYIEDISSERLAEVAHLIEPTSHPQRLARCDAILVCVPT